MMRAFRHQHFQCAVFDCDFGVLSAEYRLAIHLNGKIFIRFYTGSVKTQTTRLLGCEVTACDHIEEMAERVGEGFAAQQPHIHFAVIEVGIGRKQGHAARVMPDVRCNRQQKVTVHAFFVGPYA